MLRLILTRHAKSAWDDVSSDDFDRPLNARGRKAAKLIGGWLAGHGAKPDIVLCSAARRTRETWAGISGAFADPPQVAYLDALYLAPAQTMLDVLRRKGKGDEVMIVGHNPGCGTMAAMLAQDRPDNTAFGRYPTCFTTIMEFDADRWADVDWGKGRVVAAISPKELAD